MPMYVLRWDVETVEKRLAFVEADSELAAYDAWARDGYDLDSEEVVSTMTAHCTLDAVDEITEHDRLCCCPWCMTGDR